MKNKVTARMKREARKEEMLKIIRQMEKEKQILSYRSTPSQRRDFKYALKSVKLKVDTANSIAWDRMTKEETDLLIKEVINNGYRLVPNSPEILKRNIDVALASIRINPNSVEWVSRDLLEGEYKDRIVRELIDEKFTLKKYWVPDILKSNLDLAISSIKTNPKTIEYVSEDIIDNPLIDKECYEEFNYDELKERPIINYNDKEMLKTVFDKLDLLNYCNSSFTDLAKENDEESINLYIDRFSELFATALSTKPTVKGFKEVLDHCANVQWDIYRANNIDKYSNIFRKICTTLENNKSLENAKSELFFLKNMEEVLSSRYSVLEDAMADYFDSYHKRKGEKIDSPRDTIARLSALYISKCKESYKKEQLAEYFRDIKEVFIPKRSNPKIAKRITDRKQYDHLLELYENENEEVLSFLTKVILDNYDDEISQDTVEEMVHQFIPGRVSKMDKFIKAPRGWNNYKRFVEATKLVNRLNSKYLNYTDRELERYSDIVKFDSEKYMYYYDGPTFTPEQIEKYTLYSKKMQVFDKVKQQIMMKAKELYPDVEITDDDLEEIKDDIPLKDEYFEFDTEWVRYKYSIMDFYSNSFPDGEIIAPNSILIDWAYEALKEYVVDNSLVWFLLVMKNFNSKIKDTGISNDVISATFDFIAEALALSMLIGYEIKGFSDVLLLIELAVTASPNTIAILGPDVVLELARNNDYDDENATVSDTIEMASDLVCKMTTRSESTVPYINGKCHGYNYSMYDALDNEILLAGIKTDACFRINGHDHDFLHYCALDKNGFVIKITNSFGEFIGRAAGFRNGNCVYVNQLRTIYDKAGNSYEGELAKEQKEIIDVFRQACEDIVSISQNNPNEKDKIDYVFVNKSYSLDKVPYNVSWVNKRYIGKEPMDRKSADWEKFIESTKNLKSDATFDTDYGMYDLICMASSDRVSTINRLGVTSIKRKDVPAVYKRTRNKIIVTDKPDRDLMNKINRIYAIRTLKDKIEYGEIDEVPGGIYFVGDNWFAIYQQDGTTLAVCIEEDKMAVKEISVILDVILESMDNDKKMVLNDEVREKVLKIGG